LRYGPTGRQSLDLFCPETGACAPIALFVHGGYWRSLEPSMFSHMAAGLNAYGLGVAIAGYDLCPQVKVATIIEEIRNACLYLWRRFGRRMLVFGHSAGGHLAAAMLATDWTSHERTAPPDLVPAAYAISGLFDLTPLVGLSMNQDLRLDPEEARQVSPAFWPAPQGRVLDAVVGARESSEFLRQSRLIAEVWGKEGATTRYEEIAGADHFTVIDLLAEADSPLVERVAELARSTESVPS
jgi:arylformamidase